MHGAIWLVAIYGSPNMTTRDGIDPRLQGGAKATVIAAVTTVSIMLHPTLDQAHAVLR